MTTILAIMLAALAAGADAKLAIAVKAGDQAAVQTLLQQRVDVNAKESWHGETALMWAVSQKHPKVARELIAKGADVKARSITNKWERQQSAEPREKWLPLGGLTPLEFAARDGCVECIPVLLE